MILFSRATVLIFPIMNGILLVLAGENGKGKTMKSLENDIAVELLERSKLYFEYQETQYAAALDRIRKLEEKGLKVFCIFERDSYCVYLDRQIYRGIAAESEVCRT